MSRHRQLLNIDVHEERSEFDDYGHSVEEGFCLSPSSEQYMFRPNDRSLLKDFINGESSMPSVPEEPYVPLEQVQRVVSVAPKPQRTAELSPSITANGRPQSPHVVVKSQKVTAGFAVANPLAAALANQLDRLKVDSAPPSRSESPARGPSTSKTAQTNIATAPSTPRIKCRPAGGKSTLNLVVVGHVDAGKSTLMGHFLYLLGNVNQKTVHKYKQDSQKMGKASFAFAWVLDEGSEERARGVTMDIARTRFSTEHFEVVLLDAPGHKDFIPNMITGAAQADAALLVVNATTGEFETGFDFGGQTREHTMLVRSLGVSQIAVVVNKLDTVSWSKDRFDEVEAKLKAFLKQTGFSDVQFVPCSGLGGDNLVAPPDADHPLRKWYHGLTLLQVIDGFKQPERSVDKPLRLCISDIFKGMTSSSLVSGKIETGAVQVNEKVVILPSGESSVIKGVQTDEGIDAGVAYAGDQCNISFVNIDLTNIAVGDVICHPESPIAVVTKFEAKLVFFNVVRPITKGYLVVVHCNSIQRSGCVSKLLSQLNTRTGEVVKAKPRCFGKNTSGVIEITTDKPICLELYSNCKELGRVTLRSEGVTVASGVVLKLSPVISAPSAAAASAD